MGAWGYKPLDTDEALDWLARVTDHVGGEVDRLLTLAWAEGVDSVGHELRAAAHVVLALNFFNDRYGDLHARLAQKLTELLSSDWLTIWDEPETVRAEIERQIEDLESGQQPTTLMPNLIEHLGY